MKLFLLRLGIAAAVLTAVAPRVFADSITWNNVSSESWLGSTSVQPVSLDTLDVSDADLTSRGDVLRQTSSLVKMDFAAFEKLRADFQPDALGFRSRFADMPLRGSTRDRLWNFRGDFDGRRLGRVRDAVQPTSPVPEPSTILLLGSGVTAMWTMRKYRPRAAAAARARRKA